MRALRVALTIALTTTAARAARAGDFDELGAFHLGASDAASLALDGPPSRYTYPGADPSCAKTNGAHPTTDATALEGTGYVRVQASALCPERFLFKLPANRARYRASLWVRHGGITANVVIKYPDASGLDLVVAQLGPTGRATSDGWVELATNDLSADGEKAEAAYVKLTDFASENGVDVDALELVETGDYAPPIACDGSSDVACGPEASCYFGRCFDRALWVGPLPRPEARAAIIDVVKGRVRWFFGGKRSRAERLDKTLADLEALKGETTSASRYWNGIERAIEALHDWHTGATIGDGFSFAIKTRLDACFVEGDADLTHAAWPKDPLYPDVLVSHIGAESGGLHAGDRLVAIDGEHPIRWAMERGHDTLGLFQPTDPSSFAEYVEMLGGPPATGGATILRFASTLTVLRCDAATSACASVPETIHVKDLVPSSMALGGGVECDHRPRYHLGASGPDETTHVVGGDVFRGKVDGTSDDEKIFGMVWNSLAPDVKPKLDQAVADWKAGARGVILDHRTGNGGTFDAIPSLTTLVRPPWIATASLMPMQIAGWDGPKDAAEGVARFEVFKLDHGLAVGDAAFDPTIPVALLVTRDGSASDFFSLAMKGAPHVKLFGPHVTAGAFSTFIDFEGPASVGFLLGSGETLTEDGSPRIGQGVEPDVIVTPKQSDLVAGKDTLHEAALAWVRSELKP